MARANHECHPCAAIAALSLPPSSPPTESALLVENPHPTDSSEQPRSVLRGHGDGLGSSAPDVYSVAFHSGEAHVVTAGHDRTVRLYDIESGQVR